MKYLPFWILLLTAACSFSDTDDDDAATTDDDDIASNDDDAADNDDDTLTDDDDVFLGEDCVDPADPPAVIGGFCEPERSPFVGFQVMQNWLAPWRGPGPAYTLLRLDPGPPFHFSPFRLDVGERATLRFLSGRLWAFTESAMFQVDLSGSKPALLEAMASISPQSANLPDLAVSLDDQHSAILGCDTVGDVLTSCHVSLYAMNTIPPSKIAQYDLDEGLLSAGAATAVGGRIFVPVTKLFPQRGKGMVVLHWTPQQISYLGSFVITEDDPIPFHPASWYINHVVVQDSTAFLGFRGVGDLFCWSPMRFLELDVTSPDPVFIDFLHPGVTCETPSSARLTVTNGRAYLPAWNGYVWDITEPAPHHARRGHFFSDLVDLVASDGLLYAIPLDGPATIKVLDPDLIP